MTGKGIYVYGSLSFVEKYHNRGVGKQMPASAGHNNT